MQISCKSEDLNMVRFDIESSRDGKKCDTPDSMASDEETLIDENFLGKYIIKARTEFLNLLNLVLIYQ